MQPHVHMGYIHYMLYTCACVVHVHVCVDYAHVYVCVCGIPSGCFFITNVLNITSISPLSATKGICIA